MIDLSTKYLGLSLKNPLIVSSCGLTNTADKIEKLGKLGAGAVVLKSLFEEQINYEAISMASKSDYPEAEDYIRHYTKSNSVEEYLKVIEQSKRNVKIPVIASINCISANDWVSFARQIEEAGADALELNVFFIATDKSKSSEKYEDLYYEIVTRVKEHTSLPVSVKIGPFFTNVTHLVNNLYFRGVSGAVLFNRFYAPDIDLKSMKITSSEVLSSPADIRQSLRWIGLLSDRIDHFDLSASTGVHDSDAVIKLLLAGATTVQVCSVLYKNGIEYLQEILSGLSEWMKSKEYSGIDEFRGKMNYKNIGDPALFERSQFMKYFSSMQ